MNILIYGSIVFTAIYPNTLLCYPNMPVRGILGVYASSGHLICAREGHSERPSTYILVDHRDRKVIILRVR